MRRVFSLLAVCALGFAPAPFLPKPAAKQSADDLKLLQGEWVQIKQSLGSPLRDARDGSTAVITGDRIAYKSNGTTTASWTLKFDPGASPKRLDLCGRGPTDFVLCIYRVEGDTLTICWRNQGGALDRPGEFATREGWGMSVYQRRR